MAVVDRNVSLTDEGGYEQKCFHTTRNRDLCGHSLLRGVRTNGLKWARLLSSSAPAVTHAQLDINGVNVTTDGRTDGQQTQTELTVEFENEMNGFSKHPPPAATPHTCIYYGHFQRTHSYFLSGNLSDGPRNERFLVQKVPGEIRLSIVTHWLRVATRLFTADADGCSSLVVRQFLNGVGFGRKMTLQTSQSIHHASCSENLRNFAATASPGQG